MPLSLLRYGHSYGVAPASLLSLPTSVPAPDLSPEPVAETEKERGLLMDKKKKAMRLPVLGVRVHHATEAASH